MAEAKYKMPQVEPYVPTDPVLKGAVTELNASVKIDLLKVLANVYGEGFAQAVKDLPGKEPAMTSEEDKQLLIQDVDRMVRPIHDYNQALAGKVQEIIEQEFEAGKDEFEVAKTLRTRIPEILNNEPITIQRPGKRPVSFTAEDYAQIVADTVPYAVRNAGYIRGLEESGADGWMSVAAGDEVMCEECGDKNGQVYEWDDPQPPYHPHCRCRPIAWFRPKTKEEQDEADKKREARIKALSQQKGGYSDEEEADAIYGYQDYAYGSINDVLRGINLEDKSPEQIEAIKVDISKIDSAFSHTDPLDKKGVVYRADGAAISAEAFEKLGIEAEMRKAFPKMAPTPEEVMFNQAKPPSGNTWSEYLNSKLAGYEFEEKAFISTSKTQAGAKKFLAGSSNLSPYGVQGFVELEVPKGTKIIDVDKFVGNRTNEAEQLIDRNQKIVIDRVIPQFLDDKRMYLHYKAHLEPLARPEVDVKEEISSQMLNMVLPPDKIPGTEIRRPKLERREIDINNSPTIQRFKSEVLEATRSDRPSVGSSVGQDDRYLHELAKEIGYTDLPTVVSEDQMNKVIEDGNRELFRGYLNKDYADQFKSGEYFASKGIHTSGVYTAYGRDGQKVALDYAQYNGVTQRLALDVNAKVIDHDELVKLASKDANEIKTGIKEEMESFLGWKETALKDQLDYAVKVAEHEGKMAELDVKLQICYDPGRYAITKGYDAIDIKKNSYMVLLNRKAVYVQDLDYTHDEVQKLIRSAKGVKV